MIYYIKWGEYMKKKGFTITELIAVIVILSIIAAIAVPIILNRVNRFRETSFEKIVLSIENATEQYVNNKFLQLEELSRFGHMTIRIDELLKEGFLSGDLINPTTGIPIPLNHVIYVTLDHNNKIDILYDPNQSERSRITLIGPKTIRIKKGSDFTDPGAIAMDKDGNNITSSIVVENTVDINTEGTYILKYSVQNSIVLERAIIVTSDFPDVDKEPPILTSNIPNNYIETTLGNNITMPIVTATDNVDGVIYNIQPTSNTININSTGTYYIKYDYTDSSGNKADTLTITVVVKP